MFTFKHIMNNLSILKEFLSLKNISSHSLSIELNYSYIYVSRVLSGSLPLSQKFLKKFLCYLDVYLYKFTLKYTKEYEEIYKLKEKLNE